MSAEMTYTLLPRDLLFFRDARPMDIDKGCKDKVNVGHGANWPRPDHLFNGVMHALLQEIPNAKYGDFPSLKVMGPYPVKNKTLYLPRPLDWDMDIFPCEGTDLPCPLKYGFLDRTEGKKQLPSWIKVDDYKHYLNGADKGLYYEDEKDFDGSIRKDDNGNPIKMIKFPYTDGDLFCVEKRIGTTLDASTGASKRVQGPHNSGQYQCEYLRLYEDVAMWCSIETGGLDVDVPNQFKFGGQAGIVFCGETEIQCDLPKPQVCEEGEVYIRWTLLAPALFTKTGWYPGWCEDSRKNVTDVKPLGDVMFPDCEGCHLVGACIGNALVFSGWDMQAGAKPTQLAVPAGSAYLFKCDNKESAEHLIDRLHLKRQSDYGPQGFGIGVCSLATFNTNN